MREWDVENEIAIGIPARQMRPIRTARPGGQTKAKDILMEMRQAPLPRSPRHAQDVLRGFGFRVRLGSDGQRATEQGIRLER